MNNTMHPSEEELILHFYGESAGDEQALDAHLTSCASCQDAWRDLKATMSLVDTANVPEPDASFEQAMWARVQPSVPVRQARILSWRSPRVYLPLASAAALVIAFGAFAAGRTWSRTAPATTIAKAGTPAEVSAAQERVLLTALNDHFERSEMLLVEVMNAPDAQTDFQFERATAGDLVASSRLYRQTAEQHGDVQLTALLENLESVLIEVARSPEHVSSTDVAALRTRINDDGLLFKVRAVANEIEQRQQHTSTLSEGTL